MNDITLTFGKHNGKKLSECPREYVEWLSQQATICGKQTIPEAARAYLEGTPDTRLLYPCDTIEDAEKLSWLASARGDKRAARTLLAERAARGDKEGYVAFYGDDNDEFLFHISDAGTGYVTTRVEIQEREEEEAKEAEAAIYKEAHPDLEWVASAGQTIKIWIDEFYPGEGRVPDMQMYIVSIDGKKKQRMIEPIPASKRTQARANGIVAVLGSVGLTAERKAILEEKAKVSV